MPTMFHLIKADVKFKTLYECVDCGKTEAGDQVHMSFLVTNPDSIKHALDYYQPISHYMPVGWSYNGTYHCERCKS